MIHLLQGACLGIGLGFLAHWLLTRRQDRRARRASLANYATFDARRTLSLAIVEGKDYQGLINACKPEIGEP